LPMQQASEDDEFNLVGHGHIIPHIRESVKF
jgi:hypothetical protein